jgi:hypothetical protein
VEQQFAEMQMKLFVQPTCGMAFQRDGPLHHGEPAIKLRRETRQTMPFRLRRERRRFLAAKRSGFREKAAILKKRK